MKKEVQRPDSPYLELVVKKMYASGLAILGLIVINIAMAALLYMAMNQPTIVTVIERDTGRTYASASQAITQDLFERQLVFYTRQFIEDYVNTTHTEITGARRRAWDIMHPRLRTELGGEDWLKDQTVRMSQSDRLTSTVEWLIQPAITSQNDPVYSTFSQVKRVTRKQGFRSVEETFNFMARWGRIRGDGASPFERPHNLVLLELREITQDKTLLNEQLNLTYR